MIFLTLILISIALLHLPMFSSPQLYIPDLVIINFFILRLRYRNIWTILFIMIFGFCYDSLLLNHFYINTYLYGCMIILLDFFRKKVSYTNFFSSWLVFGVIYTILSLIKIAFLFSYKQAVILSLYTKITYFETILVYPIIHYIILRYNVKSISRKRHS